MSESLDKMVLTDIRLSVALVTRNRPESLERTLKSLRAQSVQPWEVVISDDSDEKFKLQVQNLALRYDCRYVEGPKRGLYANRNQAALACKGTYIRSMDDDHEFPPDHMASCIDAIKKDLDAIWVIGEYRAYELDETRLPDYPGDYHPRGFTTLSTDLEYSTTIADGSSIYPRTIFDSGNFYIEDYKFGSVFFEFGERLHWLGYNIRILSTTYVIHNFDPNTRSYSNSEINLSSQFYTMFCHSFIYQTTLKNKVLTSLEVARQVLSHPKYGAKALKLGYSSYLKRRRENIMLKRLKSAALSFSPLDQ